MPANPENTKAFRRSCDETSAGAVLVGEVAAGEQRDAEHGEEARRHDAEPRARVLVAGRGCVALGDERDAWAEAPGVAPGQEAPDRCTVNARQLDDAPRRF